MNIGAKSLLTATIFAVVAGAANFIGILDVNQSFAEDSDRHPFVKVIEPKLNQIERLGKSDFEDNCAACHGENAAGTSNGPPLVYSYYRPQHHPDAAFYRAASKGVQAHHWDFGNMPPPEGVKKFEVARIIAYVRALQRANGVK